MRARLTWLRGLVGAAVLAASVGTLSALGADPAGAEGATEVPVEVVVAYDAGAASAQLRASTTSSGSPTEAAVAAAAASYSAVKHRALSGVGDGVTVVEPLENLPVQVVRVSSSDDLERLAAQPGVTGVSPTTTYRLDATANLELVQQPAAATAGFTGRGSRVAVLDSGFDPDGTGGLFGDCGGGPGTGTCRVDFHENVDGSVFSDLDVEQHGTNVASIVANVAPEARFLIYGVFFPYQGELITTSEVVLAALDHLAEVSPGFGVRAVNLSFGDPTARTDGLCSGSPFTPVFEHLRSIGIAPVVASGNGAYDTGTFQRGLPDPACAPGAVSVGAVYTTAIAGPVGWGGGPLGVGCTDVSPTAARVTCFSQTGATLTLLAPGVEIFAGGVELSGTSQAAPHVSGAFAVLNDANPALTVADATAALVASGPIVADARTNPPIQRPLLDLAAASRRVAVSGLQRIQGADRIATAVATSKAAFPGADSAGGVVVASSETFPDGLAGTPLAVAAEGPMLLTSPGGLRDDVAAEIQRVLRPGGIVFVLGGTTALAPSVENAIAGAGFEVHRISGADRYATAVAIADLLGTPSRVFLATGLNFPDALAAGVAAATTGGVVLFTQGTTQAPPTQAWLSAHPAVARTIVGGTALGTAPGATEIVGADRYETATKLATTYFGSSPTVVALASGEAFPDALSGGAHIARLGGPILLTRPDALPPVASSWLSSRAVTIDRAVLYGGPTAISGAAEGEARTAIG